MSLKILDLGCGKNKIKGSIGLDNVSLDDVDIVHDILNIPYPLEDNYFDCHSDLRSPKIKQLEKNKVFSALFYSSEKKIQLRFKGTVEIFHKNSITKQRWDNVTPSSKRCYMGPYNPSDILEEYHPNIPDNVQFKDPTDQDSLSAYNNFVIIRCHFYEIDFLKLKYSGHQRCKFILDKEKINVSWVAP